MKPVVMRRREIEEREGRFSLITQSFLRVWRSKKDVWIALLREPALFYASSTTFCDAGDGISS